MNTLLQVDAKNRALRTFLVGLAMDVAVALVLVLVTAFNSADGWGDFEWKVLGFTLGKTLVTTAGSYILRRFVDPSGIPTPLPPAPVPAPADNTPEV
jgi:hypothetical protein